jgi:phosphoenolpyruvate carboxykinase (ATP)
MLGERITAHDVYVWLVNTGWTAGPYGSGHRMKISYTRAMISAALSGTLDGVEFHRDPVFNVEVPVSCPGVPAQVLTPRSTWSDGSAYDDQAAKLARLFADNFKTFEAEVAPDVRAAGPNA